MKPNQQVSRTLDIDYNLARCLNMASNARAQAARLKAAPCLDLKTGTVYTAPKATDLPIQMSGSR